MTCPQDPVPGQFAGGRIFPDKPEPEYVALKESISRLGLLDRILMWRGMVVDGYHRLRACLEMGVEPRFDVLSADADPMEIVVDRLGTQRHLNETARAAAAVRALGKPKPGRPKGSEKKPRKFARFPDPPVGLPEVPGQRKDHHHHAQNRGPAERRHPGSPSRPRHGPHFGQRRDQGLAGKPGGAAGGHETDFQRRSKQVRRRSFEDQERCGSG